MPWPTVGDLVEALPWLLVPLIALWRGRNARTLAEFAPPAPDDAPLVSVIVPARNEARNIARCVASILATTYPRCELLLVDDHSTDGTADAARAAAAGDSRLRILASPPLVDGWFGKQWACATGAAEARGELLLFADADTAHGPELLPRLVTAQRTMDADLISVAGQQEMGSFWERLVQPQIFAMLFLRYGGTEGVNRARRAVDVIANGQCLMVRRTAYDAIGGHAAVRDRVAEDLMLAQTMHARGHRVRLVLGTDQLATRMYTSLRELVAGWGKNVYAGGVDSVPFGWLGRLVFPLLLLGAPVFALLPPFAILLGALGVVEWMELAPAMVATAALLAWWTFVYRTIGEPLWYAVLFPLGSLVLLYIFAGAIVRGRRVAWKGRRYVTARSGG